MIDAVQVSERLAVVRDRIARAGGVDVHVMGVTKTWGIDAVRAAAAAGCDSVGENYAQELATKFAGETGLPQVHFIGRLQTNKVRLVAPFVDVYETVDRGSLAAELAKRAPGAQVLVQVSTDADPDKGGCALDDVSGARRVLRCTRSRGGGADDRRPHRRRSRGGAPGFRAVRALVDRLGLAVCSMGMSDDLEVAVQEGSTQVRVGSALFGPRTTPASRDRAAPPHAE